ncbi:hypothetical protein [Chitinophaga sancti]|uniref:Uncharacterized protein n=1 Tax=Chitinophaga sancti TaxID=1004 RepID=A0ABZ0XS45_9BACT|nr:hypothetical protein [Chitinophaga sancti]WQD61418.1 hypothetical protein U0033_26435 [Chitinophaga sancti]WQG93029.1 hypothetical protein SR876_16025 [Chitinophaga sancti]
MNNNNNLSKIIHTYHGRTSPEEGYLIGYGALIDFYQLGAGFNKP